MHMPRMYVTDIHKLCSFIATTQFKHMLSLPLYSESQDGIATHQELISGESKWIVTTNLQLRTHVGNSELQSPPTANFHQNH
jgi:predicted  nucleic acid-binding Zn ribbon protein